MDFEDLDEVDLETFEEDRNDEPNENDQEGERNENEENNENSKPVKPKRVVRNPQPKLNEETLKGKRGLTALESYFERVKYKGRGYEEQDLSVILKTYEYWCHRLFPRYPFDDCIAKIEKLGTKRAVQTHLKKIRLDMVHDDEPVLNNDDDSLTDEIPNNQLDDLFDDVENNPNLTQTPIEISEEQLERIRLNKEKAERLRQERLQKSRELTQSSQSVTENSQNLDTTQYSELTVTDNDNNEEIPSHSELTQFLQNETESVQDFENSEISQLAVSDVQKRPPHLESDDDEEEEDTENIFNKIQDSLTLDGHDMIDNGESCSYDATEKSSLNEPDEINVNSPENDNLSHSPRPSKQFENDIEVSTPNNSS